MGYFLSAATAALTKNDIKPSLTPCSFSNLSLWRARKSMMACILTSLKVVRMAAVDWDWTRRSAMRARSRDIVSLRSERSPAGAGAGETGVGVVGASCRPEGRSAGGDAGAAFG